jgi:hypothetical protein
MYQGKHAEASHRIEEDWPLLKRHYFLSFSWVRDELANLRARAAIGLARDIRPQQPPTANGHSADAWLKLALREARNVERHGLPFGRPLAELLRAGVSAIRGRRADSLALLRRAASGFEAIGMSMHQQVALYCIGAFSEGANNASTMRAAEHWMRAQGVEHPRRIASLIAPGILPPQDTPGSTGLLQD